MQSTILSAYAASSTRRVCPRYIVWLVVDWRDRTRTIISIQYIVYRNENKMQIVAAVLAGFYSFPELGLCRRALIALAQTVIITADE